MNQATSAARSSGRATARARRGNLIYGVTLSVLAGVFFAALGAEAGLAAALGGLVIFAACHAVCRAGRRPAARRPLPPGRPAAGRYPGTLTGWAQALGEDLAALGHEMRWGFEGGETASTFTGTCYRCGGQVIAGRAGAMGAVTVSYPGRVLLQRGPSQVLRRCGGRR